MAVAALLLLAGRLEGSRNARPRLQQHARAASISATARDGVDDDNDDDAIMVLLLLSRGGVAVRRRGTGYEQPHTLRRMMDVDVDEEEIRWISTVTP